MDFFFTLKLVVVLIFLVIFLRRTNVIWGIGLLTVTTALLLDAFLGTFGRDQMAAELGFFFYVITGALFAGAALWLWGLLRPWLGAAQPTAAMGAPIRHPARSPATAGREELAGTDDAAFDRQMLFEQIRERTGPEDVRDLIFDVELNENDILAPHEEMSATVVRLMDAAERQGKMGALALAVERILTPVPPENLPRREKLSVESPPTVLRHFLIAHYRRDELAAMANSLGVDAEMLGSGSKQELARNLLLHLQRRGRLEALLDVLRAQESGQDGAPESRIEPVRAAAGRAG